MNALQKPSITWSPEISHPSAGASADVMTRVLDQPRRDRWTSLIDEDLIEWGRNPDQFDDDDTSPPSRAAVQAAITLAQTMRDSTITPAPRMAVPSGDGGIFMRWGRPGQKLETVEIRSNGELFYTVSHNCREESRIGITV